VTKRIKFSNKKILSLKL